jgi:ribose transport system substrate-binding protein
MDRIKENLYALNWKKLMKRTTVFILFALISISGLWTYLFSQDRLKIAVIPKNSTSIFWKTVHAGAKLGAMGSADIMWKAPQTASDKEQQIAIVERCIADGASGIVLSPIDYDALAEPVNNAMKNKIPVLIFDSALKGTPGKDYISFVGIDNKKAGGLAGDHLARLLDGKGSVVLLRYIKGQANTSEREEGFLEAISQYHSIRVIVKDRYAGATVDDAKRVSANLMSQLKEADGVFCPNEVTTMGMLLALRESNLAGKIKFVGFDIPSTFTEALEKGEINALIIQNASLIGFLSVKIMLDKIRGKKIPATIDTGIHLIVRKDLNDPDVKKILTMPSVEDNS